MRQSAVPRFVSIRQQILAQENPLGGSNIFGSVMIVLRK